MPPGPFRAGNRFDHHPQTDLARGPRYRQRFAGFPRLRRLLGFNRIPDQLVQLAVITGVAGLQPRADQLEAVSVTEQLAGDIVQLQHPTCLVEH
ncbi:hypothetical protein D3C85_1627120 [compost metagenome]